LPTGNHQQPLTFAALTAGSFEQEAALLATPLQSIHVWSFALDASHEVQFRCCRVLSPDERARAARFRFDRDREHFVVAHAYLRLLLGRYCGMKPGDVVLGRTKTDKPMVLRHGMPGRDVMFNLTHSHGRGMIAVSKDIPVGIDLEPVRPDMPHVSLAKRYFSPAESRAIEQSRGEIQPALFCRYWVGKESMLKGKGLGLRVPLDRCELVLSDAEDEGVINWAEGSQAEVWRVRYLPLDSGWLAAVAAQGSDWTVTYCA
jgi:4'-phosphopantetheinyl transferase